MSVKIIIGLVEFWRVFTFCLGLAPGVIGSFDREDRFTGLVAIPYLGWALDDLRVWIVSVWMESNHFLKWSGPKLFLGSHE
ncbi:hypothetical protein GBA52_009909 [Prunus armeniaca]|nr:hypothetical protein GBA52_009909 [Prunus armeniaca]